MCIGMHICYFNKDLNNSLSTPTSNLLYYITMYKSLDTKCYLMIAAIPHAGKLLHS
jgi:hypothetical protein